MVLARLSVLLACGHRLVRLRAVSAAHGTVHTQRDCDTLATLTALTTLDLRHSRCTHLHFLQLLPQLASPQVQLGHEACMEWARVFAALLQCHQLAELSVSLPNHAPQLRFAVEQLQAALCSMPLLCSLTLRGVQQFVSISFLVEAGTLASTLTSLTLEQFAPRLPVTELRQVRSLRSAADAVADGSVRRAARAYTRGDVSATEPSAARAAFSLPVHVRSDSEGCLGAAAVSFRAQSSLTV